VPQATLDVEFKLIARYFRKFLRERFDDIFTRCCAIPSRKLLPDSSANRVKAVTKAFVDIKKHGAIYIAGCPNVIDYRPFETALIRCHDSPPG